MNDYQYVSPTENLKFTEDGLLVTNEQYLGKDFWESLQQSQDDFHFRLNGLTPVATIPEAVVDHWFREGFDIFSSDVTSQDILNRLRRTDMSKFIISGDKTF